MASQVSVDVQPAGATKPAGSRTASVKDFVGGTFGFIAKTALLAMSARTVVVLVVIAPNTVTATGDSWICVKSGLVASV